MKLRPAVALAVIERGDFILCQVTSKPYADHRALELHASDFKSGGLDRLSYARPGKLFTASHSLLTADLGELAPDAFRRVLDGVIATLRGSSP